MSLGANMLKHSLIFHQKPLEISDIEILEYHHNRKTFHQDGIKPLIPLKTAQDLKKICLQN